MLRHRFQEYLNETAASFSPAPDNAAFVPFSLGTGFSPGQQAQIMEIYRIAAERTREQLASRSRFRIPQFSVN